jgi:hypothetical protein
MALQSAKAGMTLLKRGPLPFTTGKSVAVIGQNVNNTDALTGNYDGPLCAHGGASCFPSVGQAVASMNFGGKTTVVTDIKDPAEAGASNRSQSPVTRFQSPVTTWTDSFAVTVAAAKAADFVILAVDNFRDGGGEGHDRYTIALSSSQLTLANAVLAVNKNAVLVTINGGLISVDDLKESAPAILNAGMPVRHSFTVCTLCTHYCAEV